MNETGSASFFCNATSFSPFRAHISWSKKGDSRKIFPAGEQLVLQKVGHSDEGTYICTAENGVAFPDTAAAVLTVLRKFFA